MDSQFPVSGRVAVITWTGRGAAMVLAQYGADVVVAGRRPEPLESTAVHVMR